MESVWCVCRDKHTVVTEHPLGEDSAPCWSECRGVKPVQLLALISFSVI